MNMFLIKEQTVLAVEQNNVVHLHTDTRYAARPYDERTDTDPYADKVWESIMQSCAAQTSRDNLRDIITPRQRKLTMLRADGYSDREIAHRCGIKPSMVKQEIQAAGSAVRNLAPELYALIAA